MKTLELNKASRPLAEYVAGLDSGGLVLTSGKRAVAALVSLEGVGKGGIPLGMNPVFLEIVRRARAEIRRGKVVSLEQVKKQLFRKVPRRNRPAGSSIEPVRQRRRS